MCSKIFIFSSLVLMALSAHAAPASFKVTVMQSNGAKKISEYTPPKKAKKQWKIGVVIPTLQDSYWKAAHYGLVQEAKRLGVKISIISSKDYTDLKGQNNLLEKMAKSQVDAIIFAPINSRLQNRVINSVVKTHKKPLIGLINPIFSNFVKYKREVSYFDTAYKSGEFVVKDVKNKPANVLFFPGPAGSGWAEDMYKGFRQAINANKRIKVKAIKWGDTKEKVQRRLLLNALSKYKNIDYIVGNAVMASAAIKYYGKKPHPKIVTTYANPDVFEGVKSGQISMAPTDYTARLARFAVDAAVEVLEGKPSPNIMGPVIGEFTLKNISQANYLETFAPKNYNPK